MLSKPCLLISLFIRQKIKQIEFNIYHMEKQVTICTSYTFFNHLKSHKFSNLIKRLIT